MRKNSSRNRRHKRKQATLKILIFITLITFLIIFAFNSSFFHIKEIKTNGNKQVKEKNILLESNIKKNTNIFKLKSEVVEKNIEKNPFIKSATVKKKLPSTIELTIVEREKMFSLKYNENYLVVDEYGFIMEKLEKRDKKLVLVKGFNTDTTKLGENILKNQKNNNLNIFINEIEKLKILSKIDEIEKDFANEVNIKLKNDFSVAFGTLNNVKYKLSLLKEILDDIEKKKIKSGKIIMNKGNHPILIIDD